MTAPPTPPAGERRLGPVYVAVLVVEAVTLAALWWFQSHFGR
jgi:hypothetical protein